MRTTELSGSTGIDRRDTRLHPRPTRWIRWILAFTLVLSAVLAQAQEHRSGHHEEFRFRYVSLDDKAPPGFSFFAGGIDDRGRVDGTVVDPTFADNHVAFYENGVMTVSPSFGFGGPVNARGTIGGSILLDPLNFIFQGALFRGGETELIPRQPGEVFSSVIGLNDSDTALVDSDAASGQTTYMLYSKGQATPINFGLVFTPVFFSNKVISNRGVIAGTTGNFFNGARGFRFDTRTGALEMLEPVQPDEDSWGVAINRRGDVLGYSFVEHAPYHERIGVWDRKGHFHTYIFETFSTNRLMFNDHNLIVITSAPGGNSYLVPMPGVRLNLADLVENLPFGEHLVDIYAMNNRGDMLGFGSQHTFLLQRMDSDGNNDEDADDD